MCCRSVSRLLLTVSEAVSLCGSGVGDEDERLFGVVAYAIHQHSLGETLGIEPAIASENLYVAAHDPQGQVAVGEFQRSVGAQGVDDVSHVIARLIVEQQVVSLAGRKERERCFHFGRGLSVSVVRRRSLRCSERFARMVAIRYARRLPKYNKILYVWRIKNGRGRHLSS